MRISVEEIQLLFNSCSYAYMLPAYMYPMTRCIFRRMVLRAMSPKAHLKHTQGDLCT